MSRLLLTCQISGHCRFIEGLARLGVLDAIKRYPKLMEPLFVHDGTATTTLSTIKEIMTVSYSEVGSNRYHRETETYALWMDYLEAVEGTCNTNNIILYMV